MIKVNGMVFLKIDFGIYLMTINMADDLNIFIPLPFCVVINPLFILDLTLVDFLVVIHPHAEFIQIFENY